MKRPAVAKHLRVLGEGGLIRVEARGRSRINHLDAVPLEQVASFVSFFEAFWDDRLARLKEAVEQDP